MSAPASVTPGRYTTMQLTSIFVSTLLGYSLDGYNLIVRGEKHVDSVA